MRILRKHLGLTAIVGLALSSPTSAHPQTSGDSAAASMTRAQDSTIVQLAPSRPRQGSILRITVRPAARPDSAPPPRTDSLTRPASDSLAVPRDSLKLRADSALSRASDSTAATIPASAPADSTLGRILIIRGTLFGEPLHFEPADSGRYVAIGGIPVDAPRSVRIPLIVDRAGMPADTVVVELEIARTAYRMEKLTVAPRFGQAPDSALAARIAREQALAASVSRGSHATPKLWSGGFTTPRASRVTSRFGDGREFNGKVQSRHMGLDLAGAEGAPVLAPDRGVVALVGDFYYAGNAVYIDHGAGLVTAYFHLSAVNVAQGDTVVAGDTIGKVGATGRVTGPHLHWVARYGSVTVDPSSLLEIGPARREP
jgi:murein DD-endopeptidase MepM/ murein hydrolase activator NlpD